MTITASCGHVLEEWETEDPEFPGFGYQVRYWAETCDAIDGYTPCLVHATFCFKCTMRLIQNGESVTNEPTASEWDNRIKHLSE